MATAVSPFEKIISSYLRTFPEHFLSGCWKIKLIGRGASAEVCVCSTDKVCIVVRYFKEALRNCFKRGELIPLQYKHPYILKTQGIVASVGGKLVFLEKPIKDDFTPLMTIHPYYPEAIDLLKFIEGRKDPLPQEKLQNLVCQIFAGLSFLHENKIIHRDLKVENILLTSEGVKIIDFGYATFSELAKTEFCGSLAYVAPEVLCQMRYDAKADIFSFSVVIYMLAFFSLPLISYSLNKEPKRGYALLAKAWEQEEKNGGVLEGDYPKWPNFTKEFTALHRRCSALHPEYRSSTVETKKLVDNFCNPSNVKPPDTPLAARCTPPPASPERLRRYQLDSSRLRIVKKNIA